MSENRITETGVFGPVFSSGVRLEGSPTVTEGIVEIHLLRGNAFLTVEMTIEAADTLADLLANAVTEHLKGTP